MSKDVLIIYPQLEVPLSGGQVIDFIFIDQLKKCTDLKCKYLNDKDIPGKSIINYVKYTLSKLNTIGENDIIFTNSRMYTRLLPCILLLKLLRVKMRTVCYHHHYNYMTNNGISKLIHFLLEISFLRLFDDIIIPSPYVFSVSKHLLNKNKLKYIEIGFIKPDTSKINIQQVARGNLLFVGTLEKRKNIHHLLELARYISKTGTNFTINIVGRSPDKVYFDSINEMIKNYHLENCVQLKGRVGAEELDNLYRDSDIFVFPSSHEGYGMVLIEAMMHGLPIVAYNNSAMPFTVIHDYNGLLASNESVTDLSNMTNELLTNESLFEKLRAGALETASRINSYDLMVDEMKCVVETLC